ncbi:MAG: hypothetical protein WCV73_00655 [Patescibacteria group bacterium]|jgi:hypothetical protein
MKKFFNNAIKNPVSISVIALFMAYLIWWIWSYFFVPNVSSMPLFLNVSFDIVFQLVSLFGGIFGLIASKRWGGTKSFIGRSIIAFSIGLLLQCFGNSVYSYNIRFLNIQIPYPSIGDLGYVTASLFYIYGALMLAKVSKTTLSLKLIGNKIWTLFVPLIMLIASYAIFLQGYIFDWSNPVKIFLDFIIPFIDAIPIMFVLLAFLLSKEKLGGAIKKPLIFFILALVFQYLSDFIFLYQANNGIYFTDGFSDLMYAISYILMTLSLILLSIWPSILPD